MNECKTYTLIFLFAAFFLVILLCLFTFKNSLLASKSSSIALSAVLAILLICELICIVHLTVYKALGISIKYQDGQFVIQEGKEIVLFIPSTCEELSKINVESNILSFVTYCTEGTKFELRVVQNKGLLPNRKFNLTISDQHQIIDKANYTQVNSPGLCIVVKTDISQVELNQVIEGNSVSKDLYSSVYKEIRDRTLFLERRALKFVDVKNDESAKLCLSSVLDIENDITLYDCLLQNLFESCPIDKKSMFPKSKGFFSFFSRSNDDDSWINGINGKIALFLLTNFPLDKVIGRKKIHGNEVSNLNRQISYVQSYIDKNPTVRSVSYLDKVFDMMKSIACSGYKIDLYDNLCKDYCIDGETQIHDLVLQDLNNPIYKYVFAIASYQDGDASIETNEFIRELLAKKTDKIFVDEIDSVLSNNHKKPFIRGLSDYKKLKIDDLVTVLSLDPKKRYTAKQLISSARAHIMKKYTDCLKHFYGEIVSVKVGDVRNIMILEDQTVLSNFTLINNVANVCGTNMQK